MFLISQIQMNMPLKLTYSDKLNKLENQYERLLVSDPSIICNYAAISPLNNLCALYNLTSMYVFSFRAVQESGKATWKACMTLCLRRLRSSSG